MANPCQFELEIANGTNEKGNLTITVNGTSRDVGQAQTGRWDLSVQQDQDGAYRCRINATGDKIYGGMLTVRFDPNKLEHDVGFQFNALSYTIHEHPRRVVVSFTLQ